jgi:hypothetical protein
MNRGTPVTACHARTGLFTAPGIFSCALSKSRFDFVIIIGGVQVALACRGVKILQREEKDSEQKFFLEKDFEKDYDLPSVIFIAASAIRYEEIAAFYSFV